MDGTEIMRLTLTRFNKKKKELTIRMDRKALQTMYGMLVYMRLKGLHNSDGKMDEFSEEFCKLWNKAIEKGLFDDQDFAQ